MFAQLLSDNLLTKIDRWDEIKRWERKEIGQELRRMGLTYRDSRRDPSGQRHVVRLVP